MSTEHATFARRMAMLELIPEAPAAPIPTRCLYDRLNIDYPCSKRTIERDLEALSAWYPFYSVNEGKGLAWLFKNGCKRIHPASSSYTALSLTLAEPYLKQLLPAHCFDALRPQFAEANAILDRHRTNLSVWPERMRVLPASKQLLPPSYDPRTWEVITAALLNGKKFTAAYTSRATNATKQLQLSPLAMVAKGNTHYLVATANDYDEPYIYAIQRIAGAVLSETYCKPCRDFDLDNYLRRFGWTSAGDITLEATISGELAKRLQETPLSKQQFLKGPNHLGQYKLEAIVPDDQETRWWVMGLNQHIRVTAPMHWVEELRATTRAVAQLYEHDDDDGFNQQSWQVTSSELI